MGPKEFGTAPKLAMNKLVYDWNFLFCLRTSLYFCHIIDRDSITSSFWLKLEPTLEIQLGCCSVPSTHPTISFCLVPIIAESQKQIKCTCPYGSTRDSWLEFIYFCCWIPHKPSSPFVFTCTFASRWWCLRKKKKSCFIIGVIKELILLRQPFSSEGDLCDEKNDRVVSVVFITKIESSHLD